MKKFAIGLNCKILLFCHVTNMGVSTTEMNSNSFSVKYRFNLICLLCLKHLYLYR
jgi:hypothetical protein